MNVFKDFKIPQRATITHIDPNYFEKVDGQYLDGLYIKTDKGEIKILISDEQCCCENAGCLFLETPDDFEKVLGKQLLKVQEIEISNYDDFFEKTGTSQEVNETQIKITYLGGSIQFAIYNDHNGYYAHSTLLQVFDDIEHYSL